MRSRQMYCTTCHAPALAQQQQTRILVHIMLILITAGLWLPIFLLIELCTDHRWRCPRCGSACVGMVWRWFDSTRRRA